jgi:hypothetical protein
MTSIQVCRRKSHTIVPVTMRRSREGRTTERRQDKSRCWRLARPLSAHAFWACRGAVGVPRAPEITSITVACAAPRRFFARMSRR